MRHISKRVTTAIIIAFILTVAKAYGGSVSTNLQVRAWLQTGIEYRIIHERKLLKINPSDKKKGYKNIKSGTILSVKTDNPNGYIISVACHESELFVSLEVREGDRSFMLTPGGQVDIIEPNSGKKHDMKKLDYKFYLSPDVQIGTYQWPIAITVYPM